MAEPKKSEIEQIIIFIETGFRTLFVFVSFNQSGTDKNNKNDYLTHVSSYRKKCKTNMPFFWFIFILDTMKLFT